jgi:hypothetical protein
MAREWVVLVEAAGGCVDRATVSRLVSMLGGHAGDAALYDSDRCAIQVRAEGANPAAALSGVFIRWEDAVAELELQSWDVVRAEVLTLEEFESDFELGYSSHLTHNGSSSPATVDGPSASMPTHARQAEP